jgi:hypothetical protein
MSLPTSHFCKECLVTPKKANTDKRFSRKHIVRSRASVRNVNVYAGGQVVRTPVRTGGGQQPPFRGLSARLVRQPGREEAQATSVEAETSGSHMESVRYERVSALKG